MSRCNNTDSSNPFPTESRILLISKNPHYSVWTATIVQSYSASYISGLVVQLPKRGASVAKRQVVRRSKDSRKTKRNTTNRVKEPVYGVGVLKSLHDAIESERGRLLKAESIVRCLKISLESETSLIDGPYYPDIAEMARELIRQAFNGLDLVNLDNSVVRGRIQLTKSNGHAEQ
jgi:hypothetical protein